MTARVSAPDRRSDLDRQVARAAAWVAQEGLAVGSLLTEVGSALNGTRRRFLALRRDPTVTTIVVEPRDRLARFGAEEVEAALAAQGGRQVGVDPSEVDEDLVRDVSELLSGLGARRAAARPSTRGRPR
ncbi:MAG TPA: recombinase family protein [Candidatus Dormibacteraeota bacterium]|nr:recombinase family protein [Candidatus Dormibacteraeota bacterium]